MKSILMVIPFKTVYPPMNGGMQRCFNLLHQLCRHFKVTAIVHQDEESFIGAAIDFPALKNCRIISTASKANRGSAFLRGNKYLNAIKYRVWNRSLKGPAGSNFLSLYPIMKRFLTTNKVDAVILEDMDILNLSKLVRRCQPEVPVIYDAYNVNTVLAAAALQKGEISKSLFEVIQAEECNLYRSVHHILACSTYDLDRLKNMNSGKISGAVIPNGVVMPKGALEDERRHIDATTKDILFCGALDYSPNREGLQWFISKVFPLILSSIPGARLLVVGRGDPGSELNTLLQHPSIINYGMVDSVAKYYKQSNVAVVPLLSGSGTRLKLLEAMAFKAPIIATATGAEGIEYIEGEHILIADEPSAFASKVITLLSDRMLAERIADNAFSFVQKQYDWNIIGNTLASYLEHLITQ